MAINFPNSPFVGQLYTYSQTTWEWSGEYWNVYSGQTFPSGLSGASGRSGISGESGISGSSGTSGESGVSGISGIKGNDGISSSLFYYLAKTTSTSGNPSTGYTLWNNFTQTASTEIIIHHLTSDLIDIDVFLSTLSAGEKIIIQQENNSENYQIWIITGTTTNVNSGTLSSYWIIPVSYFSSLGLGSTNFTNNLPLFIALQTGTSGQSGVSGQSGLSGTSGESGISGLSGISGESGLSGISGISGISGTSGLSGISGISGFSGESGLSGISGISGEFGISGISGISGLSGLFGISGQSGISGLLGLDAAGCFEFELYSTGYTGDPGSGKFAFQDENLVQTFISNFDLTNTDLQNIYIFSLSQGGFLQIREKENSSNFILIDIIDINHYLDYAEILGNVSTFGNPLILTTGVTYTLCFTQRGNRGPSGYSGQSGNSGISGLSGISGIGFQTSDIFIYALVFG